MICATVGCENVVPRHEWPTDKKLPILCDPCLRSLSYPVPVALPADGSEPAPTTADFGESSDFE